MTTLVLAVIGDARSGLVSALSGAIADHGGSWERSQMARLAGKFAGIVVVSVADEKVAALTDAVRSLDGLLEVSAHPGADVRVDSGTEQLLTIDLLGNDRPGIVHEVSSVLNRHKLSIEMMETHTREAPMAGGQLFEAHIVVKVPAAADPDSLRSDLERLATELLVDIALSPVQ